MDYKAIIETVYNNIKGIKDLGEIATYIPELAKVDPNKFGVHLCTIDGFEYGVGDCFDKFSIQSIAKVLSLCLAYHIKGESIWNRLGVEPSGNSFNSLAQLEYENGIPRNPFINAGAMVICDILISELEHPKKDFLSFLQNLFANPQLAYSQRIVDSEKSIGYRNIALCNFIKSFDNIKNDPEEVLDFYFNLCSIEANCQELSKAFLYLANRGVHPSNGAVIISPSKTKRVNAVMQTCGFYDESGEFSFKVGLPGKSGVGGGILAVHPDRYCISVWSPRLNKKGNSYRGMRFLELFTAKTDSSIF